MIDRTKPPLHARTYQATEHCRNVEAVEIDKHIGSDGALDLAVEKCRVVVGEEGLQHNVRPCQFHSDLGLSAGVECAALFSHCVIDVHLHLHSHTNMCTYAPEYTYATSIP